MTKQNELEIKLISTTIYTTTTKLKVNAMELITLSAKFNLIQNINYKIYKHKL